MGVSDFPLGMVGEKTQGIVVFPDHTHLLFKPCHEISNNVAF